MLVVDSDPLNENRIWAKVVSLKIFGGGHITIFAMVFAVDDSAITNERMLMIYLSQCTEMRAAYAVVVSASIGWTVLIN